MGPALETVTTLLTSATNFITGNDVMMTLLCGSLMAMGFKLFKKAKRAVR